MTYSPISIYIHIPFCREICTYCAFNTYADMDDTIEPFVEALMREIRYVGIHQPDIVVGTIFFGGGTPSMLSIDQFRRIFATMQEVFHIQLDVETSLEANPNDLNFDYLAGLRAVGFNRLSIGMQSAKPDELSMFRRQHDVAMTHDALDSARRAGFGNISLDLIFGSPNQTLKDWENTLAEAVSFQPNHISLYGLEIKGGTVLKKQVLSGIFPKPDDDLAADMYEYAMEQLAREGFLQYEISNWCKLAFEAQHNLQYWHNLPYLGFGAGAHGYANEVRTIVIRLPERYIKAMDNMDSHRLFPRSPATSKATRVDKTTEMSETIMMGLRLTNEGINREAFRKRFGVDLYEQQQAVIDRFVEMGFMDVTMHSVRLSQAGRLLSNAVIRELI